jgi:acyl-coenzyme A synthetase/AMP-(fatty) acid ligase/acyl carrier protein
MKRNEKIEVTLADFIDCFADSNDSAMQDQTQKSPLTYRELSGLVDSVAMQLQIKGIQQGNKVMVYLPRDFRQLVTMLAVWRLGAVYVPQDTDANKHRVDIVRSQLQPDFLITSNREPNHLTLNQNREDSESPLVIQMGIESGSSIISDEKPVATKGRCQIILVDDQDKKAINFSNEKSAYSEAVVPVVTGQDQAIAYYIYTSGSTGDPKPIPITHKGMAYWRKVLQEEFKKHDVCPKNVLENISCAADPQIWNVLVAATVGACLHMTDTATRTNNKVLADFIVARKIDTALVVPTQLKKLTDELEKHPQAKDLPLKVVFSTGEALTRDICERLFKLGIEVIFNAYGPSQTTFGASILGITKNDLEKFVNNQAPIGLPFGEVAFMIKPDKPESDESGSTPELIDCRNLKDGETISGELIIKSPFITPEPSYFYPGDQYSFAPGDKVTVTMQSGVPLVYFQARTGDFLKIKGASYNLTGMAAQIIKECKHIKEAILIYGKENGILFAHVVTSMEHDDMVELRLDVQAALDRAGISLPVFVFRYPAFVQQAMGKIDRKALRDKQDQKYSLTANLKTSPFQRLNLPIEQTIRDIILASPVVKKLLADTDEKDAAENPIKKLLGINFRVADFGLDSLDMALLVNEIEEYFGIKNLQLYTTQSFHQLTIGTLAKIVFSAKAELDTDNAKAKKLGSQLVHSRFPSVIPDSDQHKPVIFVFPDITGMPPEGLMQQLKSGQEKQLKDYRIIALQARGIHEANETSVTTSLEAQARDFFRVMKLEAPNAKWYLVGWSYAAALVMQVVALYEKENPPEENLSFRILLPRSSAEDQMAGIALVDDIHPACYQQMPKIALFNKIVAMLENVTSRRDIGKLCSSMPINDDANRIEMINNIFDKLEAEDVGNKNMLSKLYIIKSNLLAIQTSDIPTSKTYTPTLHFTAVLREQFTKDFENSPSSIERESLGWFREKNLSDRGPYGDSPVYIQYGDSEDENKQIDHAGILTHLPFIQNLIKYLIPSSTAASSPESISAEFLQKQDEQQKELNELTERQNELQMKFIELQETLKVVLQGAMSMGRTPPPSPTGDAPASSSPSPGGIPLKVGTLWQSSRPPSPSSSSSTPREGGGLSRTVA